MCDVDQIVVEAPLSELSEDGTTTMLIRVTAPGVVIEILGSVSIVDRALRIDRAHIDGASPGRVGRAGLNAIGRKLLQLANEIEHVESILIQGSTRATGRNAGKRPRPIRFPRR